MIPLIAHIITLGYNVTNAYIDAYRIFKNKTIAHALNFGVYSIIVLGLLLTFKTGWLNTILFSFASLFSRQILFDIPLNIRRFGWKGWNYVSQNPAAWWDRVENRWLGKNGTYQAIFYLLSWTVCLWINFK